MRNIISIITVGITYILSTNKAWAIVEKGIFENVNRIDIRRGDIHAGDIPGIIGNAIDFFMGVAGTIAIIFIIIGAYRILFGSVVGDSTKGKETIFAALAGFALASLSWLIISFILENLSGTSL